MKVSTSFAAAELFQKLKVLREFFVCVCVDVGGCCVKLFCDYLGEVGLEGIECWSWVGSRGRSRISRSGVKLLVEVERLG
jgi:hypothetical protein